MDRRTALIGGLGAALLAEGARAQTPPPHTAGPASLLLPDPVETIDLWPSGAPGMPAKPPVEVTTERSKEPARFNDRSVEGVTRPRMAVFRPAQPNGAALLLFPGGGYSRMVLDKEGYEIGRLLAPRGFTTFVLFYRLPGDGWAAGPDVALQDAQRAMRLIRARAASYGLDPARVAAMGHSAGGHLCADLVARFATPTYTPVDAADALSARPMIAAPIYPVVTLRTPYTHAGSRMRLLGANPSDALLDAHSPHLHITRESPPCFVCAAEDDTVVPVENSLLLHDALRAAKVPVEMHLFERGGHGFGLRSAPGTSVALWPELFLAWAKEHGWG